MTLDEKDAEYYERIEKLRDNIVKRLQENHFRRGVIEGTLDPTVFNRRDLGIRRYEEVYPPYDHGPSNFAIQKAIFKAHDFNVSQREAEVNSILRKVAGGGFYSYLKLRKMLGFPKESFKVRPWYGNKLAACISLINPGGLVWIAEGTHNISQKLGVIQNVGLLGAGERATAIKPTADIISIEIKPTQALGEAGTGIAVEKLMIDDTSQNTSTKAAISLDGTDKQIANVLLSNLLINKYHDGIVNNPKTGEGDLGDPAYWCWHHTLKDITINDFRGKALHYKNVADTLHHNMWVLSSVSSEPAVYIEKLNNASSKVGGNIFSAFRVFNEKVVDTAHGFHIKDVDEMWFSNVICESSGVSFWLQNCRNLFMNQCWGVGYPPIGRLKEGFKLDPVEGGNFTNCYAHDNGLEGFALLGATRLNTFVNCVARNNSKKPEETKHGFILWGYGPTDMCELNRFVNCKSYDDQETHTQYGGFGERNVYTDYNILVAPITFGNTDVTINLEGAHSHVEWSNEVGSSDYQVGTATTESDGTKTVTFPTPFKTAPRVFIQGCDGSGRGIVIDLVNISSTQFVVKARKVTSIPIETEVTTQITMGEPTLTENAVVNATCPAASVESEYVVIQVCQGGVPTCPEIKAFVADNVHSHSISKQWDAVAASDHKHGLYGQTNGSGSGSADAPALAISFYWLAMRQQP